MEEVKTYLHAMLSTFGITGSTVLYHRHPAGHPVLRDCMATPRPTEHREPELRAAPPSRPRPRHGSAPGTPRPTERGELTAALPSRQPGGGTSEEARSTSCNLQFDSDFAKGPSKGLLEFRGCSSLVINYRKQDQERKGHWMRFGKSAYPELDLNYQLGLFMDLAHTLPSSACAANQLQVPGKRCLTCAPLFPKLVKGPGGSWVIHPVPVLSPACVSAMVVAALRMIGVDTMAFSGVCCHMGASPLLLRLASP
jgi:hypothetical protein